MANTTGKLTPGCRGGAVAARLDAALGEVAVSAVVGGVDTHGQVHVAAALDQAGRVLGTRSFAVSEAGYAALAGWLAGQGGRAPLVAVGVEGTGSYGAGLARALVGAQVTVVEVDRPDRAARRRQGKDDDLDAINAARAVLGGRARAVAKQRSGASEAIRALRAARAGAVKARTAALNQLKDLRVTAPAPLRAGLEGLSLPELAARAAALRPARASDAATLADPTHATKLALRRIARRIAALDAEISEADAELRVLIEATAPATLGLLGAGTDVTGQLLVTAGENPDRLHNEAALARLLGVAPIPASSGNTRQHRLHRGGDRAANAAIYRIALVRMRHHQPTRDYVARRTAEGLTKRMIIRCLKRYIVREVYHALISDLTTLNTPKLAT
jgi:transposase